MRRIGYALMGAVLLTACGGGQLVKDSQTRRRVAESLAARSAWLPELPADLDARERDGMEFLYAYMPVGDAADYAPELYLSNVRASLRAADEMSWGGTVPN
ncbi:MAG: transglutaminase domain-containing protein, partial [Rikenella sp.]|nr:transglutaminase domain-containing protein [Rikenella sp.]